MNAARRASDQPALAFAGSPAKSRLHTSLSVPTMNALPVLRAAALLLLICDPAGAADPVFSGPQPGERITPFKVMALSGPDAGSEREPVRSGGGDRTALVFVHTIERSLVPLLRVIDEYGALHTNRFHTELVFLAPDRLQGEQRVKAASASLKLQSRVGLSLDGPEGPGNYGLNRDCLMTVVLARDNVVTTNFALVQPGIADAPRVLAALAQLAGDTNPPTPAELTARQTARSGGRRDGGGGTRGDGMRTGSGPEMSRDYAMDLNSEAGLREAVRSLAAEVQALRAEVAALKAGRNPPPDRAPGAGANPNAVPGQAAPGAPPTDPQLLALLRTYVRTTNDVATVDRVLAEVRAHVRGRPDLERQAIDGWVRVLHYGDRYGTAYSRKAGRELVDELRRGTK